MRWGARRVDVHDVLRFMRPRRRWLNPLVLWRWRGTLALVVGIPLGLDRLAAATHPVAAACLALAATVACLWWTPARRLLADRARCAVVQHRLRVGMVQAGVLSWSGRLPAILRASPTSRGVRVVLWCPAGVDVHAFLGTRELLAAACWAADVEVARHPRWANLVVLLVVTRPDREGFGAARRESIL